ncbi:ABC transporter permease [Aureivirga sp. CE67]|uniref:ABC transporter permease n=1 Tax=Aureivirga sp. CE67 TaxID=1788983 RepID=UPI0018C9D0F8|nr:ABC transporter permease [Aureivirga sp. CE67]
MKFDKIFIEKLKSNISEALRVIKTNKVRTFLTALGIIFGVGAVITMLAIGNGAEKEILSQLELIGVNNIVIEPIPDDKENQKSSENEDGEEVKKKNVSKGLDMQDLESIQKILPTVKMMSPEIIMETRVIKGEKQKNVKLIGITNAYFSITNMPIEKGVKFSNEHLKKGSPVCIIGKSLEKKLFTGETALGKQIKVKDNWLTVIGITEEKMISEKAQENLGIRDVNKDIYVPIKTFLVRYKNRKKVSQKNSQENYYGEEEKKEKFRGNYHQLDKLTIQIDNSENLSASSDIISRMLKRKHSDILDFEIFIPVHLLKQQQKTKQIFNIVLSIIAGISLLIGGIGIMNIMLASVLERTKEIGIMRAIGATKEDIVLQFLSESIIISLGGGVLGVVLGVVASVILEFSTGIETILSVKSILLSFFVSSLIGLIFGIAPAKKAANKSPIEAMRYE